MKIYFVTCNNKEEIQTIADLKPKNILISWYYFNKREKIEKLINAIGYRPNIMFDSGAFSSNAKGKDLSLTAHIKFIKENIDLVDEYIMLDVFEKEFITKCYYDIMRSEGLEPIPVFHYGFSESLMEHYISTGAKKIALGGTVGIKSKTTVSEWAKFYCWAYPDIKFHLLGSSSLKILDNCDVHSVDASTWIMMAIMGKPSHIKNKVDKMRYNMAQLIKYEEESND